ncbi:hypothetical protein, partial [Streptococcus agalactiae]|uniref:hypothetical protein n=1 Tax=Streptococcus agalactiae TaxID=1311 RepID=UPI001C6083AD
KDGMRNSNVMAIAPTATISNICGVSQSIEPTFQNLYVKSNLSGAIQTSSDLAVERGAYSTFKGSLWDQGILPIDSLEIVAKSRPERMFEVDRTQRLDWDSLRAKVQKRRYA